MLSQIIRQFVPRAAPAAILPASLVLQCRTKKQAPLDYSRYPTLKEEDLEETLQRGSGPGGQAVNMTNNCVLLRHKPTNIIVKCHKHRIASRNRIEARRLLLEKLDMHLNGEHSIAAQMKVLDGIKLAEKKRRQQRQHEMKRAWKAREKGETEGTDNNA